VLRADTERRRPLRSSRETWFDHGVLALALVLLLSGFGTIVEGSDWWVTTMLVAIMTGLTCALLRGLGFRLVAPVAILVEFIALTWIFVPETLIAILPTKDTFVRLGDLAVVAREIILEEQAPVGAAKPIVLLVAGSFGLIVIVADAMLQLRRAAALTGVLLLAVFATPALISGETPSVWLFLGVAALWLVLLRTRTTTPGVVRRGYGPAMTLGGAALAAAVAFPIVSPDVSAVAASWGKPPSTVFGRGINPMLELGQNLRRNSDLTALTYRTSLGEAQYLKVATLQDFTGRRWEPSRVSPGFVLEEGRSAIDPSLGIEVEEGNTTITIQQLRSPMLPVPYPAVQDVKGLESGWDFRDAGLTLTSTDDDLRGQTYTVPSLDVEPTAEQMRGLSTDAGFAAQRYLQLPRNLPAVIEDTAREVTADADNDYDRVMALQRYFRDGDFRYSETAPVADDYDGDGVAVIAKFLEAKAGYCVHFSSAMAVMARTLDIPSRIAVGYAPGSTNGLVDGETEYKATSSDLHAWTEIYFEGVGWVRFDPTTSVGSGTSFAEPVVDTPDSEVAEDDSSATAPVPAGADRLDDGTVAPVATAQETAPRTAIVTAAALVVLGLAPWLVRSARRRWRMRQGAGDVEPLWRELEDVARDLRIPTSAADTPRGFAGRLARRPAVDADSLEALLRRVELARFARDAVTAGDGVADLRAVVGSLRAGASRRHRWLATFLPQSLTGRAPVTRIVEPRPATA
jgi:transglutaminase-like putative cysteine protease